MGLSPSRNPSRTLLLFSGGHDSAFLMRSIRPARALFVNYGQDAWMQELSAAVKIANKYGVNLSVKTIDPLERRDDEWVGRNLVLIGLAVSEARSMDLDKVVIGCTPEDFGLFPDCRDEFISGLNQVTEMAYGVRVEAPLKSRPSYLTEGTWSCYYGESRQCGECYSCRKGESE